MASHVTIQKYRNSLTEFQKHVEPHFNKRVVLHGHESRYNPMGWVNVDSPEYTRGVQSDLILIYQDHRNPVGRKPTQLGERNIYNSIAFSFNQDDDDPTRVSVSFSFKENGEITSSEFYPESVFRDLIRQINRTFRNEGVPKSRADLMKALGLFLDNEEAGVYPFDPEQNLNELLGAEGEHIEALSEQIHATSTFIRESCTKLEKLSSVIAMEMDASPEAEQIRELQKKIDLLRAKQKRNKKARLKEDGAEELELAIEDARSQVNEWIKDLNETARDLKRKTPPGSLLRENFESWFNKHRIRNEP